MPNDIVLVATLISNPSARALTPELARRASAVVGASAPAWLADGVACDLILGRGADPVSTRRSLETILEGAPVDIVIQNLEGRRKAILVADMDSTMIDQECIDELADVVGIKPQVAAITARSMNGEIAFEPALRERVALLRGLTMEIVERVIAERITLGTGGRELVATMNADGAWTALVSGGFTVFTRKIAETLGFRENRANELIAAAGKLTGYVREPILGRAAKAEALRDIAARLSLDPGDANAVGAGANDLDMLHLAGTGVALHAKPAVAAEARVRIDHGDLTALLYLQGYRRSDFSN